MREAVIEPLAPMGGGVCVTQRGLHPDLSVAHLGREGRRLVGPQIESAAAFEVEAGVVPMTGQDPVLDAAPVEREAHVRATVVEGEDAPAVIDDQDRAMDAMQDDPALRLHLFEGPCKGEVRVRQVHERFLPQWPLFRSLPGSAAPLPDGVPKNAPCLYRRQHCRLGQIWDILATASGVSKLPVRKATGRDQNDPSGGACLPAGGITQAEGFAICDARTLPLAER